MDDQFMALYATGLTEREIESQFSVLSEFLMKIRSHINALNSTEFYLTSIDEGLKAMTINEPNLENNVSTLVLWKCLNQVGMPEKLKKYTKLLLELFLMVIEKNTEDNQKMTEWYNRFTEFTDCIFSFCSKKEYANDFSTIMTCFVGILLKKIREIDIEDYPEKVFLYQFFELIVTDCLRCRTLTNSIVEEIIKNFDDVIQDMSSREITCLSDEIVNMIEYLHRYLNIVEILDRERVRKIESDKRDSFRLVLKKLLEIEVLPKYLSLRVIKLLDIWTC
ncbi:uncharacterized protein LOC123672931 [Harmonia axyridis]|uniref:uncharacterized protein LOC123672931 n=1 Tax=Harmonia axyridis TaxID=115357 RepID=UPI001E275818|nr:uncharacterized protein LOC123672931 [Harmonia axyridis]